MKTIKIIGLIALLGVTGLLTAQPAQAQDMKIGFVDPRAVLERMPEMRAVQQRLQNFAERKQREITSKERELQVEIEEYQQRVGVMSDGARQREEERLSEMDASLRQLQTQAQRELEEQRIELMSPLLEQIETAIGSIASRRGLDYVLNMTTSTGDMIILYIAEDVQDEYDITDAVMEELGI